MRRLAPILLFVGLLMLAPPSLAQDQSAFQQTLELRGSAGGKNLRAEYNSTFPAGATKYACDLQVQIYSKDRGWREVFSHGEPEILTDTDCSVTRFLSVRALKKLAAIGKLQLHGEITNGLKSVELNWRVTAERLDELRGANRTEHGLAVDEG
jgi:hypothetical protein